MYITYLKKTGELVPPIMTSNEPLTIERVMGKEKADIYKEIYGYLNIIDNLDVIDHTKDYYVDIETKKLLKKSTSDSIQYLE